MYIPEILEFSAQVRIGAGVFQFASRAIGFVIVQSCENLPDSPAIDEGFVLDRHVPTPAIYLRFKSNLAEVSLPALELAASLVGEFFRIVAEIRFPSQVLCIKAWKERIRIHHELRGPREMLAVKNVEVDGLRGLGSAQYVAAEVGDHAWALRSVD